MDLLNYEVNSLQNIMTFKILNNFFADISQTSKMETTHKTKHLQNVTYEVKWWYEKCQIYLPTLDRELQITNMFYWFTMQSVTFA